MWNNLSIRYSFINWAFCDTDCIQWCAGHLRLCDYFFVWSLFVAFMLPVQPFTWDPTVFLITPQSLSSYANTVASPWQNHQYHCPRFPVQCPNQCGTPNIAREDLANHVKDNCGSALVLCPFKDAGCKHRVRWSYIICLWQKLCITTAADLHSLAYLHACFHYISLLSLLTVSKVKIFWTYSTVPVGSLLMRARHLYS